MVDAFWLFLGTLFVLFGYVIWYKHKTACKHEWVFVNSYESIDQHFMPVVDSVYRCKHCNERIVKDESCG